jgi:Transposase DDE domain
MIETFADVCTAIYVLVDDLYQIVAPPHDHRPGPRSDFHDSEVITLTLVAELLGLDEEKRFLKYLRRHHLALFPQLPERTRFNRRRRRLIEVTNRIRQLLQGATWRLLTPEERALGVLDSLPVPVVGFHHAREEHRWWGDASYGHVASKKQTIYGFKLHLLISQSGLIVDFAFAPAHHADSAFLEQLLADNAEWTVLADKGYIDAAVQALLAWRNNLLLLTPKRCNQKEQLPAALTAAINHFRQIIETVNSQLVDQFHLQRNRAKCLGGLCARVMAKLTAHTVGVYLNLLLGRPLLALKDFDLI